MNIIMTDACNAVPAITLLFFYRTKMKPVKYFSLVTCKK
jgi:hypothetical protein